MHHLLTEDAVLVCKHELGRLQLKTTQSWVTIGSRRVLIEKDPEACSIQGCPNYGAMIKPCLISLPVRQGYSDFVRIDGKRVCLETVEGLTDGTPPGAVKYLVRNPAQHFVSASQ